MKPIEVAIQLDWVKQISSRLHDRINQVCFDFKDISLYSNQSVKWPRRVGQFQVNAELYIRLSLFKV